MTMLLLKTPVSLLTLLSVSRVLSPVGRAATSATNRARTSNSMIMLLVSNGVTRNHSPRQIIETWREIGSLDKAAFQNLYDCMSDEEKALYNECLNLFETEIVDNLPLIPSKGGVKFEELSRSNGDKNTACISGMNIMQTSCTAGTPGKVC